MKCQKTFGRAFATCFQRRVVGIQCKTNGFTRLSIRIRVPHGPRNPSNGLSPTLRQSFPVRVHRLDQGNLPFPRPALELFFSGNCIQYVGENLVIDKPVNTIFAREAWSFFAPMQKHPMKNTVSHTNIERPRKAAASVITSKAANEYHLKTGQWKRPRLILFYPLSPASGKLVPAF